MGDADLLISMEQYDAIRPVMLELGYTEGEQSDHEIHWRNSALHVELHKRLVPEDSTRLPELMGEGWERAVPESGSRYTYSPEDHYLFLFAHYIRLCISAYKEISLQLIVQKKITVSAVDLDNLHTLQTHTGSLAGDAKLTVTDTDGETYLLCLPKNVWILSRGEILIGKTYSVVF